MTKENLDFICLYHLQAQNKLTRGVELTRDNRKCLYQCNGYDVHCPDVILASHLVKFNDYRLDRK